MPEPGQAGKDFRFPGRFRNEGRSKLDTVQQNDKLLGSLYFSRRESSFDRDAKPRSSPFGVQAGSVSPPAMRRDWMESGRQHPSEPSNRPGEALPPDDRLISGRRLQSPLPAPPPPPPSSSVPARAAAEPSAAASAARAREQAALLEKLAVDDLVVHSLHGVARFKGVRRESPLGAGGGPELSAYVVLEFEVRWRGRARVGPLREVADFSGRKDGLCSFIRTGTSVGVLVVVLVVVVVCVCLCVFVCVCVCVCVCVIAQPALPAETWL